jgi:PIN domain nuclease of toxin-antitoxin system
MIILDTHIWLWWLLGDGNLTSLERNMLDEKAGQRELSVSWVSIWETEMLERKGRIDLRPDFSSWITLATQPEIARVLPVDTELVTSQRQLPDSFHGDPADRLITATSILTGYPLATHDKRIRSSGSCKIWTP